MAKFNWRAIVSTVAPTLGAALGGPLGGMAGSMLSRVLIGKDKATDTELATAMASATPDQLLALRKADQEFAAQMKSLDIDVFKLETADVQSARELYRVNYWPQITLSAFFIGGYFTILGFYITGKVTIPADVKDTVTVLIGIMSASVTAIMAFWFGSSFGSREKTAVLAVSKPASEP